MTHHVVMPFSRPQNAQVYLRHLKDQDVVWHPLLATEHTSLLMGHHTEDGWIKPMFNLDAPKTPEGKYASNPCYWKINQFAERMKLVDDDYYTLMTDDNFWHQQFWAQLKKAAGTYPPVIICAELRPGGLFIHAKEQSLRAFLADLSMLTLRGDALKEFRFDDQLWFADGVAAEQLLLKYGTRIVYAEQAMLYYNALDAAQWGYKTSDGVVA